MIKSIPAGACKAIRQELRDTYSKEEYRKKYREFKDWYWKLAADQPYIGDTKNFLWEQIYTAIAMFAYYETTGRTASPENEFAIKHGYSHLMPSLCKSDYKVFEPFHCRMIRYYTVANGDTYCDFWQVGDKSEAWREADKDRLI